MNLKKVIVLTASYYSKDLSRELLELYCADLADLDENSCIEAYNIYRKNPKNRTFPLPSQIREIVNPKQNISDERLAAEIAGRVSGAIVKFGWANPSDAKAFIGETGWAVVERRGGWSYICQNVGLSINPGVFEAQVRNQVETALKIGDSISKSEFEKIGFQSVNRINAPASPIANSENKEDWLGTLQDIKKLNQPK